MFMLLLFYSCQFVVEDGVDYSLYAANQDLLVEWNLVEEVRLHVSNAPSCPICLHPPTAAKVSNWDHRNDLCAI